MTTTFQSPSPIPSEPELESAILKATRAALAKLFSEYPEHFYYVSLITTGEAHAPFISAWSSEALARSAKEINVEASQIKWSYADSPYLCFGEEFFREVNQLFAQRPRLDSSISEAEREIEYELRLRAMENALAKLDSEGIFGNTSSRQSIVINVEVMPPDFTNTQRARRLNPESALLEWLVEAAEQ